MDSRQAALLTAGLVFVADRISKWAIGTHMLPGEVRAVIPGFFNLVHTRNPGAAFSLLATAHSGWRSSLLLALSVAAAGLVAILLWRSSQSGPLLRAGLALLLGGALGNLYDRVFYGEVTDFIELYLGRFRWPAFNVADSALTAGAVLVLVELGRKRPQTKRL